jgi:hypothetical protein
MSFWDDYSAIESRTHECSKKGNNSKFKNYASSPPANELQANGKVPSGLGLNGFSGIMECFLGS